MPAPAPVAEHLDMLRAEIRRADPLIDGTFRHNRRACLINAMGLIEPRAQDLAAEAALTEALNRFLHILDRSGFDRAGIEDERRLALDAVDQFERSIEGCRANEVTKAIGLDW